MRLNRKEQEETKRNWRKLEEIGRNGRKQQEETGRQ